MKDTNYEELIATLDLHINKKKQISFQWLGFIHLMDKLTSRHFIFYNVLNITSIVCGILVPVTINLITDPFASKLVATILGVLVGISGAINQSYKFNDRWKHFRRISEEMKIEGGNFISLSSNYSAFDNHEQAFKQFMTNVSHIKDSQIKEYFAKVVTNAPPPETNEEESDSQKKPSLD